MNRRAIIIVAALCLSAQPGSVGGPVPLIACGPFPPPYPFARAIVPDAPRYVQGQLGIVQPLFARRYLFIAWRYLEGAPLAASEQSAVTATPAGAADPFGRDPSQPVGRWLAARGAIAGAAAVPAIQQWKSAPRDIYPYYLNCPDPAFDAAADTLARLVKEHGASSTTVIEWVSAQDQVFKRCSADDAADSIRELPPASPAAVRAERSYQIAAAAFYSGNWDDAEQGFRAIAADRASRWQPWGRYLAARALVRKATLTSGTVPFDAAILTAAERDLTSAVSEASDAKTRAAAEATLRFVRLRLKPEAALLEIAPRLQRPPVAANLSADLDDYRFLLDRMVGDTTEYTYASVDAHPVRLKDEMTDWILTYQSEGDGGLAHAIERWHASGKIAWLMAVASRIGGPHAASSEVIDAIARVTPESPAFATLAFHRARLLIEGGRSTDARRWLDGILTKSAAWPASTTNLLKAARMRTARTLAEFVADAVRVRAVDSGWPRDERAGSLGLDMDATDVLNERMPLTMLAAAVNTAGLPQQFRREIAIAAWTRAVLLEDDARIVPLARTVADLAPELKAALGPVAAAASPEIGRREAWLVLLRHPGLRPFVPRHPSSTTRLNQLDPLRDHWWCSFTPAAPLGTVTPIEPLSPYESEFVRQWRDFRFLRPLHPKGTSESPAFITAAERARAARELGTLARGNAAATTLARQALSFARANPTDSRAPEALYLGVRATRYGCSDGDTGKWSKAAFDLLHRQYARTEWARRTPHWFQ